MKLKNKKTGEIGEIGYIGSSSGKLTVRPINGVACESIASYNSLAELNEEWKDYEEPKGINEIDVVLDAIGEYCNEHSYYSGDLEKIKILNTVEEKLKAWKRLNNCGLKFIDWWLSKDNHIIIGTNTQIFDIDEQGLREDLDLLFCTGGEE